MGDHEDRMDFRPRRSCSLIVQCQQARKKYVPNGAKAQAMKPLIDLRRDFQLPVWGAPLVVCAERSTVWNLL
jgi:hypothetical protein